MTPGWQGTSWFRRHGQELVSTPVISLKKGWEGGFRRTIMLGYYAFCMTELFNPSNRNAILVSQSVFPFLVYVGHHGFGHRVALLVYSKNVFG